VGKVAVKRAHQPVGIKAPDTFDEGPGVEGQRRTSGGRLDRNRGQQGIEDGV
jgi:hypothetical protein